MWVWDQTEREFIMFQLQFKAVNYNMISIFFIKSFPEHIHTVRSDSHVNLYYMSIINTFYWNKTFSKQFMRDITLIKILQLNIIENKHKMLLSDCLFGYNTHVRLQVLNDQCRTSWRKPNKKQRRDLDPLSDCLCANLAALSMSLSVQWGNWRGTEGFSLCVSNRFGIHWPSTAWKHVLCSPRSWCLNGLFVLNTEWLYFGDEV